MTHFSLLVVSETIRDLSQLMQPYHEYECTGIKDEHVIFVDEHDEVIKGWKEDTIPRYRNPVTGDVCDQEDTTAPIWRQMTPEEAVKLEWPLFGSGFSTTLGFAYTYSSQGGYVLLDPEPVGYESVEVPVSQIYPDIESYCTDFHGYEFYGGRFGRWTNPNKRWDWYEVGGRFSGRLLLKDCAKSVDSALKSEIDFEKMRSQAVDTALNDVNNIFNQVRTASGVNFTNDQIVELWRGAAALHTTLRAKWEDTDRKKGLWAYLTENPEFKWLRDIRVTKFMEGVDALGLKVTDLDPIVWAKSKPMLTAYAALTADGKWHSSPDVAGIIAAAPDHHCITIVDCHI